MNAEQISRRLDFIEELLRDRQFDAAVALAAELDDRITGEPTATDVVRIPATLRKRVSSVRWAGEVGRHLRRLVEAGQEQQHVTPRRWRLTGKPPRRPRDLFGAVLSRALRRQVDIEARFDLDPWMN